MFDSSNCSAEPAEIDIMNAALTVRLQRGEELTEAKAAIITAWWAGCTVQNLV